MTALFSEIEEYRLNVAIIIINQNGQVLWCRRRNEKGWQFPQGGIDKDETPEKAIIRETVFIFTGERMKALRAV